VEASIAKVLDLMLEEASIKGHLSCPSWTGAYPFKRLDDFGGQSHKLHMQVSSQLCGASHMMVRKNFDVITLSNFNVISVSNRGGAAAKS